MTKFQLTTLLGTWSALSKKRARIESARANQLETMIRAFETKAEPINTAADRQLEPILEQLTGLEAEIRCAMLAGIQADGTIAIPQIENAAAFAQVTTDRKREISAAAFLRAVPPSRRNEPAFAECLSVLISKAEKFLDAVTMTRLVRPKLTHSVTVTLKPE
jgi:hypothetical protein